VTEFAEKLQRVAVSFLVPLINSHRGMYLLFSHAFISLTLDHDSIRNMYVYIYIFAAS